MPARQGRRIRDVVNQPAIEPVPNPSPRLHDSYPINFPRRGPCGLVFGQDRKTRILADAGPALLETAREREDVIRNRLIFGVPTAAAKLIRGAVRFPGAE